LLHFFEGKNGEGNGGKNKRKIREKMRGKTGVVFYVDFVEPGYFIALGCIK
jgi:hypothetical protein